MTGRIPDVVTEFQLKVDRSMGCRVGHTEYTFQKPTR